MLGGVYLCVLCVCETQRERASKRERERERERERAGEQASIRPDGVVLLWCKEIKSPRAHF